MRLTNTEGKRVIPGPPFSPEAGQHLRAFQGVALVTAVRHRAPCKMALVLSLVAKLGNTWILAFDQLKTLWRRKKKKKRDAQNYTI